MMEVIDIDGFAVSMQGDYFETLSRGPRRWHRAARESRLARRGGCGLAARGAKAEKLCEVKAQELVRDAV